MKRYLLFASWDYHPQGGMDDFRGSFVTLAAAIEAHRATGSHYDWGHILDTETGNVLRTEEGDF